MDGKAGVWQTYNGQIMDIRQEGKTLEEVGHKLGVSRQRVHQILQKHYGTGEIKGMICEKDLSLILKLSPDTVRKLRIRGILRPAVIGYRGLLYPTQDIKRIKELVRSLRTCKNCGGLKSVDASFCRKCWQSDRWKLMSPEARQKHTRCVYRWKAENPGRWEAIQRKAIEKYSEKMKRLRLAEANMGDTGSPS